MKAYDLKFVHNDLKFFLISICCRLSDLLGEIISFAGSLFAIIFVFKSSCCGISCLNMFTGETFLFEYETPYFLNPTTFDELERYISTFYPKELIVISTLNQEDIATILKYIGISSSVDSSLVAKPKPVSSQTFCKWSNEVPAGNDLQFSIYKAEIFIIPLT